MKFYSSERKTNCGLKTGDNIPNDLKVKKVVMMKLS